MAAPSVTPRQAPNGIKMDNGFKTTYAFARLPNACIFEISVKPSGRDGGEPIPTSTQHNTRHQTFAPRALVANKPAVLVAAFDPKDRNDIENALLNQPGAITEWYPDGTSYSYYGYMRETDYSAMEDGKRPEGTYTIVVTNYDPVNKVEAGPVLVNVAGT